MRSNFSKRGFTVMEILVVIGIMALVSGLTLSVFNNFRRQQVLTGATEIVLAELADARNKTLAAEGGSKWGVRLASTTVTTFKGAAYVAGAATNRATDLPAGAVVMSLNLTGGGDQIVFDRLSGKTSQSGTIRVELVGEATSYRVITVRPTGGSGVN